MTNEVQSVSVELKVGKETKEVIDAVTHIIEEIKAKKGIQEIAIGSLQKLIVAVDGVEKVDDEIKSEHQVDTIAYAGRELTNALKK